jgi:aminodeoxyfutalosine synthase
MAHIRPASAVEELRNLAVSRIFLDNFNHITAYWISMGLPTAAIALNYGVDDLHGTIREEKIFHMAGAKTPQEQTAWTLEKAIREGGREPRQRNTFYEKIDYTSPEEARKAPAPAPRGGRMKTRPEAEEQEEALPV